MQQLYAVTEPHSGSILRSLPPTIEKIEKIEKIENVDKIDGAEAGQQRVASPLAPTQEERRSMQAHVRHIRHTSLLTPDALAQLGNADLSGETLHSLLTLLEGPFEERWEERIAVAWALGLANLTPHQSNTVSLSLCNLLQRRSLVRPARPVRSVRSTAQRFRLPASWIRMRIQDRRALEPTVVLAGAYFVILAVLYAVFVPLNALGAHLLGIGSCLLLSGVTLLHGVLRRLVQAHLARRERRFRATVATALGRIGNLTSVGTLARAALDPSNQVRHAAEPALRVCLAHLPLSNACASEMEPDLVPNLCRLLERARARLSHNNREAESLALDLLAALEQIGDGQAAPTVRTLINTGWTAPVNHAAKQLLPLLLARQQQETDQRVLLRGAAMPLDPPETLLRPTNPRSFTEEQEWQEEQKTLLRPTKS